MSSRDAEEKKYIVRVNAKRIKDRYSLYITIPKPIAEKLGIKPGDAFLIEIKGNTLVFKPLKPVE